MSSTESDSGQSLITMPELMIKSKKELSGELRKHNLPYSGNKEVLAKRLYRHLLDTDSTGEEDSCDSDDDEPDVISLPTADSLKQWKKLETEHIPNMELKDINTFYAYHRHPLSGAILNFNNMQRMKNMLGK